MDLRDALYHSRSIANSAVHNAGRWVWLTAMSTK